MSGRGGNGTDNGVVNGTRKGRHERDRDESRADPDENANSNDDYLADTDCNADAYLNGWCSGVVGGLSEWFGREERGDSFKRVADVG